MRFEYASTRAIDSYPDECKEIFQAIAKIVLEPDEDAEDWVNSILVTDESNIGDLLTFCLTDEQRQEQVNNLRLALGIPHLLSSDRVLYAACLLRAKTLDT